jgi:autotransporter-associated beta strand protein
MKTHSSRYLLALVTVVSLLTAAPSHATDGVWTNLSSSIWGDPTNWLNAIIADGIGDTADFSTLNPTADITVSLEVSRTNTNLKFGDTDPTGSPASWIMDNGGNAGNVLNLAGTTPTITVNQLGPNITNTVSISAVITGTNGLYKAGNGILSLTVGNTYTNGTTISNGVVVLSSTAATFGSNVINNPITFYGSSGAISNNWGAGNQISINNPIVVPTGQTGTIWMGNRIRLASSGNAATITGGGTLNLMFNTTVTRDDIGNPVGAFTGIVNYLGSGGIRHFINAGAFSRDGAMRP